MWTLRGQLLFIIFLTGLSFALTANEGHKTNFGTNSQLSEGPCVSPEPKGVDKVDEKLTNILETEGSSVAKCSGSILLDILTPGVPSEPTTQLEVKREFDPSSFYVITAIFNPASYKSRYTLYHKFAQHMLDSGTSLVTIECIFPSLGQTEFQVTNSVNPFHIQLKSEKSVYWVKEDLINIAVSKLPANAKWVAWLDADIKFHEKDWIQRSISALEKYPVVQMFKFAHF